MANEILFMVSIIRFSYICNSRRNVVHFRYTHNGFPYLLSRKEWQNQLHKKSLLCKESNREL